MGDIGKLESVRYDTARLNTGRLDTGRLGAMVKTTHHAVQQQQQQQQLQQQGQKMGGHGNGSLNPIQLGLPPTGNGAAGGAVAAVRLLSGKDSPTNAGGSGNKSPRGVKSPTPTSPFGNSNALSPTVRRSMDELPVGSSLTGGAGNSKLSVSQSMSLDMRLNSGRTKT